MADPRNTSPGSNMPNYPWLFTNQTDVASLYGKINVMRTLGVPYPPLSAALVAEEVETQAKTLVEELKASQQLTSGDREIVALIAYLQRLGKFEKVVRTTAHATP
jgi:cytochrome c oxidase cbb3-type subunit I/II